MAKSGPRETMRPFIRLCLLVAGAFVAWALWMAEILWIKGWTGLTWVNEFNWSAIPICALIAILCSYFVAAHASWDHRSLFLASAFAMIFAAFVVGRDAAINFFTGYFFVPATIEPIKILVVGLFLSIGLAVAANRWLAPLHYWTAVLIAGSLILAIGLSVLTIQEFPALSGNQDFIHVFKMGYPVFWITLLLPIALLLGRKRHHNQTA
jgi:hypothetical protein